MVPVIGLDRHPEHMNCIKDGLIKKKLTSERVGVRLTREDFESYILCRNDLNSLLAEISSIFKSVDIIFDCRFCSENASGLLSSQIVSFITLMIQYGVLPSKVVVTGSTIPASISEIIQTKNEKHVLREEYIIYENVLTNMIEFNINVFLGDYTCVSPDYSDVELFDEDMDNVTTAKLIYPYDKSLLLIRGGRFKTDRAQIGQLAKLLIAKSAIYRGAAYSTGDRYLHDKANNIGKPATASTIVPHLVNLHLAYMFNK
ncbi:hypothetical protein ERHA54_06260 [Erwinia rhapontici]|uniref:beta family protein n=1 Tax=Erwinia rhapontici TaxID=55212 RepID=UPI001BB3F923|nr:hypothetical protein [Erwinia rhapontici]BCQ38023.1 hypothetical protein ERHA54_06260 [Erwinia rhapontici]